jgi:hypothetical protein
MERNSILESSVAREHHTVLEVAFATKQRRNAMRNNPALHRCYTFQSDATWREGLAQYHGSNGG